MNRLDNIRAYYEGSSDIHAKCAQFLLSIIEEQEKALKHADDMALYSLVKGEPLLQEIGQQYEATRKKSRALTQQEVKTKP